MERSVDASNNNTVPALSSSIDESKSSHCAVTIRSFCNIANVREPSDDYTIILNETFFVDEGETSVFEEGTLLSFAAGRGIVVSGHTSFCRILCLSNVICESI
ncbi:unnamed protein product [Anisakis simplex]|uniref:Spore coat protein n=1 Tax=Anisakis simplex TaxID=6269 RepID=A0A0M3JMU7_ANISI|nr:unnamed protein product [Anisakis simplex]